MVECSDGCLHVVERLTVGRLSDADIGDLILALGKGKNLTELR